MKAIKKQQTKGLTLSAKDVEKLSEKAIISAILIDGKWVITTNKLANKTIH